MPDLPDALILCGGQGRRLRTVAADMPKPMVPVCGRPFLELLLRQLQRQGFQRVLLAVGYREDVIRSYFGRQALGLELEYSVEATPLGTGGAMRQAAELVRSSDTLVLNGDSYIDAPLQELVRHHRESNADASVVLMSRDEREDVGTVSVDSLGRIVSFLEKQPGVAALYSNAGVYMISQALLRETNPGVPASLESNIIPQWIAAGRNVRAFTTSAVCVDIGTPERYEAAQNILLDVENRWWSMRGDIN